MFEAVQTSGRGETKLGISQTDERSSLKYVINDLYSYWRYFNRSSSLTRRAFDMFTRLGDQQTTHQLFLKILDMVLSAMKRKISNTSV